MCDFEAVRRPELSKTVDDRYIIQTAPTRTTILRFNYNRVIDDNSYNSGAIIPLTTNVTSRTSRTRHNFNQFVASQMSFKGDKKTKK